jgi:deoxyribodipyrimidine photo-lyase
LPLYGIEPAYWREPDTSARQWLALRAALEELAQRLSALGAPLVTRMGDICAILQEIHARQAIHAIHTHEETGNAFTFKRDKAVRAFCRDHAITLHEYRQFGVIRPLKNRNDWSRLHHRQMRAPILPEPARLESVTGLMSDPLPSIAAMGLTPDGCVNPQPGTRAEGLAMLESFLSGRGAHYRKAMSSPLSGEHACSRLSVPLSTGAISIREMFQHCLKERQISSEIPPACRAVPLTAIDSLIARLHWHCHFIQKLESEPALEWRSQHPLHETRRVPTRADDPVLEAWATGRTGFPFVDACMRSLIATGWLNFRMRAMVQAFASYHLNLDWHASGQRLARLFTDYEPGIHWPQVQMQAGQTGINTPRIYNPVKQGLDQDPEGIFTRRWVPELALVPLAFLQEPWRMDDALLAQAGLKLGVDYPVRLVDHALAAREARARLTQTRQLAGYRQEARQVFERHGSRKRQSARPKSEKTPEKAKKAAAPKSQLTFDF